MEWRLPYFHYDVVARIIPGGMVFLAGGQLGVPLPTAWEPLLLLRSAAIAKDPGVEAGLTAGQAPEWLYVTVGALGLLIAAYVLGTVLEILAAPLFERLSPLAFKREAKRKAWRRPVAQPANGGAFPKEATWWCLLQQWIVNTRDSNVRLAYEHMHRFQAEARMFAYLSLICLVAFVDRLFRQPSWIVSSLPIIAAVLGVASYRREKRRWLQAMSILDELRDDSDPTLQQLQWRIQSLSAAIAESSAGAQARSVSPAPPPVTAGS